MSCAISLARRLSSDRTFVPANDICPNYSVGRRREDRRKRLSYLAASGIRNQVGQALSPAGDPQQYTSTKSMFKGKPSARRRERWAVIAAIAAGSVAATLLLGNIRLFQLIHLKAGDLHFLVRDAKPT